MEDSILKERSVWI